MGAGGPGRVVALLRRVVLCLAWCLCAATSSTADDSGGSQAASTLRTIRGFFVVERDPAVSGDVALRVAPLVAFANTFLAPVGYRLEIAGLDEVDALASGSSQDVLLALRSSWERRTDARDVVIGLMSTSRRSGDLGLALPATICDRSTAFAVVAWMGDLPAQVQRAARTLTHELGHVLGAGHDARSTVSTVQGNLFSIMYPEGIALTGGFSRLSEEEITSFVGTRSGFEDCMPAAATITTSSTLTLPPSVVVGEGEQLVWIVPLPADSAEPFFSSISGLPNGAAYSVPLRTLVYRPVLGTVPPGRTEVRFRVQVQVENFFTEAQQSVDIVVRSAAGAGSSTSIVVRRRHKGRVSYQLRFAKHSPVQCSGGVPGLRVKIHGRTVKLSGRAAAAGGTLVCTGLNGSAPDVRTIIVPPVAVS